MQSLHRYRSRLVGNRTQLSNQARAFLLECGIAVPQGGFKFAALLPDILEDANNALRYEMRVQLADMLAEWEGLESKIGAVNRQLVTEAKSSEAFGRLREIPGVGAQTATAIVAMIGDGHAFESGRDVAAWLGLTPREHSTGGKQRLGRISKRGNRYLRTLLVHCARSGLEALSKRTDRLGDWLRRMLVEKDLWTVIVALATRLARTALRSTAGASASGLRTASSLLRARRRESHFVCQFWIDGQSVGPMSRKPVNDNGHCRSVQL